MKLKCVGDVMLGDSPIKLGIGVGSRIQKEGIMFFLDNVKPCLSDADIFFLNLECPIFPNTYGNVGKPPIPFSADEKVLSFLKFGKNQVFSIANNHIMNYDKLGFNNTVHHLVENGIHPVGVSSNNQKGQIPIKITNDGNNLVFLGYSLRPEESANNPLYAIGDDQKILDEIHLYANTENVVIISLHWGEEFMKVPSFKQQELGRKMIDAGAKIVLGHHSHVVSKIEEYNEGMIVYSLGNFLFDMDMPITKDSMILEISINNNTIENYSVYPIQINGNYQPMTIDDFATVINKDTIQISGKELEIINQNQKDYNNKCKIIRKMYKNELKMNFFKDLLKRHPIISISLFKKYISNRAII